MASRIFRGLVKSLVLIFFGYAIWLYWQRTPAEGRSRALLDGLLFMLGLGAVVGGLWLLDRYLNRKAN
jgi:hypothetical protein